MCHNCCNHLKKCHVLPCWCSCLWDIKNMLLWKWFYVPQHADSAYRHLWCNQSFYSTSAELLRYLAALQARGILTQSLIGTYPHSSFSFCVNIHPDCSVSHHIWNSLVCCKDYLLFCQTEQSEETRETTKRRKYELIFGWRKREMWLFSFLLFIQPPYLTRLTQIRSDFPPQQF